MQALVQEPAALGKGDRDGDHPPDVADARCPGCQQVEVDVEDVLELDEQLDVEDQVVERGADCAVYGVLDRDESGVDAAVVGGV